MDLGHFELKNFRRFDQLHVDLDPRLTVLAGTNGSGKTSVLDGLALCLSALTRGFGGRSELRLTEADVRHHAIESRSSIVFDRQFPVELSLHRSELDPWVRVAADHDSAVPSAVSQASISASLAQSKRQVDDRQLLPLLAYFRSHRSTARFQPADLTEAVSTNPDRVKAGYEGALVTSRGSFSLTNSLAREELISLQEGRDSSLKVALQRALSRSLDGEPQIQYRVKESEIVLDFGSSVSRLNELSDGQKSVLGIVAELTVRAHRLNPLLEESAAERAHGVVLIDEVDLHLHPSWQRRVLDDLQRVFPKVQFIVTSHSPQVLGEVEPSRIRYLNGSSVEIPGQSIGMNSAWILEHLMDTRERSKSAVRAIREIKEAVGRGDLPEANRVLQDAERVYGRDAELQRLRTQIEKINLFANENR